ncbi:MAG: glycogen-binding domain-containing protein [Gemmatimonadaceae bacterium]
MTEPKAAIAALTFVLLAPQGALAQVASKLEAGSITTQQDGEMPASVFSVTPGIRVTLPYFALAAHGSAWLTGQQWQIADGTLSGTLVTPTLGHFRGELLGNASRAFFDQSLENDQVDAQARLHMLFSQNSGIWVGGGVARPWRIAVVSAVDVTGGGAWARLGDATLSGTYTNFFFTKVAASRDSSGTVQTCTTHNEPLALANSGGASLSGSSAGAADCRRQSRFSDLEGSVNWAYGFLELTGQAGYRFGDSYDVTPDSRRWAAGTAVLWITNRVAAVMGGGRIPANPSRGLPARNYANFGLMLSYSSIPRTTVPVAPMTLAAVKDFEVRPLATGTQKITVRVGGVETVEVMGDFSDWTPLVLMRRGRDLWDITLPVTAGVHEINLRLDGGPWLAPPGLPTRRDSFSGDVGLLVVP